MYIDKLDDVVNRYNNTYHKTIKMKPADVKPNKNINFGKEINPKDPEFKNDDIVRIQNIKIFLQNVTLQIRVTKFL